MAGQDDDDEFERLLNDFIATQLEDVEDEPAKKEPPQPAHQPQATLPASRASETVSRRVRQSIKTAAQHSTAEQGS